MDTSRVVINITDNSSTAVQETTPITGFTVVEAPKGPKTPIRILRNGAAELKDIFGVSSKEYPELFEAETFNREYDLYVSAPYISATVPVLYLTKQGIIKGVKNINYTDDVEKYVLGEIDEIESSVEGLTVFSGSEDAPNYLRDIRYPERFGLPGKSSTEHLIPGSVNFTLSGDSTQKTGLCIYTGIKYSEFIKESSEVPTEFKLKMLGEDGFDLNYSYSITIATTAGGIDTADILNSDSEKVGVLLVEKDGSYVQPKRTVPAKEAQGTEGEDDYVAAVPEVPGNEDDVVSLFIYDTTITGVIGSVAAREKIESYWLGHLNLKEDVYAAIFPKFPSKRELHIDFEAFSKLTKYDGTEPDNWNRLKIHAWEKGAFRSKSLPIYFEGSLNNNHTASDGSYLGFTGLNTSYMAQNLVCVYKYKQFTENDDVASISGFGSWDLTGGTRVTRVLDSEDTNIYDIGWQKALDSEYSDVDIFFDSSIHEYVATESKPNTNFLKLATDDVTAHELAGYVFNETISPSNLTDDLGNIKEDVDQKRLIYGKNYWNVCNIAIIEDRTNGTRFSSAMTGAHALMMARIFEHKMGGAAPMWENTTVNGSPLGGQLNMISVYKLKYKYTKKQLDVLDDLNFNPVINDRQYGIMVVGQKTCKDGDTTDWSYIGHTASFLNFLKEVRNNVMIPQIGKPNNPYYRTLRKDQVDMYLGQRVNGPGRIWAWAECDTSTADGINDVHALKARKFVIKVRVQVDVFSEKVELNFTNEGQDSIVSL